MVLVENGPQHGVDDYGAVERVTGGSKEVVSHTEPSGVYSRIEARSDGRMWYFAPGDPE